MSNLTDLLPAGGGGKQVDFVASGTIGNGATVILNNDGTVSVVAGVDTSVGTPVVFDSVDVTFVSATFDSVANKVVIAYKDNNNSNYGTAVVGTVSGMGISFGTPTVYNSGTSSYNSAAFDSASGKVVIAYQDASFSQYGTAVVGTVSGTSISFGSEVVFESAVVIFVSVTFDSAAGKVVIAYRDGGNSNYGTAIVGTVSGTSITFGTAVVFDSGISNNMSATFDSAAGKVVIAYKAYYNANYGTAVVGTVSGTSISFGTPAVYNSGTTNEISATFDSASSKVVIAYKNGGNSDSGTAIVGTVSGTSISFGSAVVFNNLLTNSISAIFDSAAGKVVISYDDTTNSNYGTAIVGTVSGSSISFGSEIVFSNEQLSYTAPAFDSATGKVIISYRKQTGSNYGTSVVFANPSSNNTSFIGISDSTISDTATGSVTIKGGISTNVTGLTPNTDYYVQSDGSLSATVSTVHAGKALSSTSILLKG